MNSPAQKGLQLLTLGPFQRVGTCSGHNFCEHLGFSDSNTILFNIIQAGNSHIRTVPNSWVVTVSSLSGANFQYID